MHIEPLSFVAIQASLVRLRTFKGVFRARGLGWTYPGRLLDECEVRVGRSLVPGEEAAAIFVDAATHDFDQLGVPAAEAAHRLFADPALVGDMTVFGTSGDV